MALIGIIGGTGVYDPAMLTNVTEETIMTPYGEVLYVTGGYKGHQIVFLARHGAKHSIPPHLINYRANIWALKKLGVEAILSTTAVGSLNRDYGPGTFVLCDQFLDFTKNRVNTFYEGGPRGVVHVDVTDPYCPCLRETVTKVGERLGLKMHNGGTYVCTEGPRFESPAEIRMYGMFGGDLVGMTNVPEVVLAAEAEICYATISMVTNYAAGVSDAPLTHHEVLDEMAKNSQHLKDLLMASIEAVAAQVEQGTNCHCKEALQEYGGFKL